MGIEDRLRRLEEQAQRDQYRILQHDGSVKTFPASAGMEAFMNMMDRIGAGDDAPPEHPLTEAIHNSPDPEWADSFFAVNSDITDPISLGYPEFGE